MIIQPYKKIIKGQVGKSLLKILEENNVYLQSLCGGMGLCGKCKVIIKKGIYLLNNLTQSEKEIFVSDEVEKGYRLACKTIFIKEEGRVDDIEIFIPPESRFTKQVLLVDGKGIDVELDPNIKRCIIKISPADLRKYISTENLVISQVKKIFIKKKITMNINALKELSRIDVKKKLNILTVTLAGDKIIEVIPQKNTSVYGIAIDIGTTKIAMYLVDLNSGKVLKTDAIMNPQIPFGEDVISRLTYIIKEKSGFITLRKTLLVGLNNLINKLCSEAKISKENIYEAVVVGNTLMHHIFFNLYPFSLAFSPYNPVTKKSLYVDALSVGLEMNPNGYIYSPPLIGGFVGADAVADILATGIIERKGNYMLIDIGTNTEIIIKKENTIVACSTASGPAFEGTSISCGMRAAPGAIEAITINENSYEPTFKVISGEKPVGLTGSGIVDLIAELLRVGIIRRDGSFNPNIPSNRIRKNHRGMYEYVIVYGHESGTKKDIVITQEDIRQIQLAKAAISAGIKILMEYLDLKFNDIEKLFVAGSFGFHINPISAKMIGLYPDIDLDRILQVGNAAGFGAKIILISKGIRELADKIIQKVIHIELANILNFQKEFLNSINFPITS